MRIIIVDDEHFACAALEKLVNDYFKEQNMQVICLTFEDSMLALEYINGNEADLLMTDIKMSGVDGLQLAETVRNKQPDMETVVISGYADFTYAQTALKCDVSDYLLKPISRKQIYACLVEQVQRYQEKCEQKNQTESVRKHTIYHRISSGAVFDIDTISSIFGRKVREDTSSVMAIFFGKETFHANDRKYFAECMKMREIEAIEARNSEDTAVLLVFYTDRIQKESLRDRALKQCSLCCKNMIREQPEREIKVSISGWGKLGELPELFRQCSYAMNENIVSPDKWMFDYSKVTEKVFDHIPLDSSFEYELRRSFGFEDQSLTSEIIDRQIKQLIEKKDVSLWSLADFISRVLVVLNKIIYEFNMESGRHMEYIPETYLGQFRTIEEMRHYFTKHIDRIYSGMSQEHFTENVVDKLVKYVEENYFLNISLAEIAKNVFYMNPSYLSRLFKAQKGISFSKFLLELRLKRAMEYFRTNSEVAVQEVASLVGFSDGSYFVKQFKKYYGETPGFYQKRCKKNL